MRHFALTILQILYKKRDLTVLRALFESLLHSYAEDVEKYAATSFQVQYIRHIMATAFVEAGNRIAIGK